MSHYIMSDIHGCYDEFIDMLGKIYFSSKDILICAGDYIDRGKQSYEMLRWIENRPSNVILVKGNHDEEFAQNIDIMQSICKKIGQECHNNNDTDKLYEIVKELSNQNESVFDYYGTVGQMIKEKGISLDDLVRWKNIINEMPFYYDFTINNRECIVVHAGYIDSLDGIETEDEFNTIEENFNNPDECTML